ncbi:hypothetical protein [Streptomyces sp. NPDC059611]|uniref:hypothetical protein n=1 Tax=Streptomyces sp. NPDC059611 TaxID=3346884 RepID=UPI0036C0C366
MLEDVLAAATTAADGAEDTAAAALKNRDLYDQDQLQPARIAAQQAEKLAQGLSRESARLKEWLDSSDYLAKQQIVINAAKAEMERAQNTWDTALAAHEVRRKEIVGRWTELFLLRLQQINPNVETAYIDAADFTTRVKEHNDPDKGFADCFVMGSPKVVINVALLLSLRDLGRTDPGVRVPPLLIIDSPLADLGVVDRATGDRLIDIASDTSSDGYACRAGLRRDAPGGERMAGQDRGGPLDAPSGAGRSAAGHRAAGRAQTGGRRFPSVLSARLQGAVASDVHGLPQ